MDLDKDPFCPELNNKRGFGNIGAPPKPSAKLRKPSRILRNSNSLENNESFSTQQRTTKRVRKQIRTFKVIIIKILKKYCLTRFIK